MKRGYLNGITINDRIGIICKRVEEIIGIKGIGDRLRLHIFEGNISLSTPIWTNFANDRGLPISCYGTYMEDSMESILDAMYEIGIMTKNGGGTSVFHGALRERGASIRGNDQSSGAVHFMRLPDTVTDVISQGSTRRGNNATYLNIDHPDIMEHLSIRSEGSAIQDLSFGVTIPDYWMKEMIADWKTEEELQAEKPANLDIILAKRDIWARVIEVRCKTGYPYLVFSDNVARGRPDCYQSDEFWIWMSNLCTEIFLPNNSRESFVCDLASANIARWYHWKDTDVIFCLVCLLDAVASEFIEKAKGMKGMERAARFAERHRALGIGWLGWHSFLQSQMIPFESFQAKMLNVEIARHIKEEAYRASTILAEVLGEPEVLKGYGRRNTTLLAIAPTKSSAFILGQVSEGVEPIRSNYFIDDKAKGKFSVKNPQLIKLLEEKGQNNPEVWDSILKNAGSVRHLDFLTDYEKDVFKTFGEISPREIVAQAAARQNFIDQGQSINTLIDPEEDDPQDISELYITGWELGMKSFYYQIGVNAAQKLSRDLNSCTSCEA